MKKLSLLILMLISAVAFAQIPANDICTNATVIALPASGSTCINSTNANATSDGFTTCEAIPGKEVWYRFVATNANNTITVTPTGGSPLSNAVVTLTTTGCGSGTYNVCNTGVGAAAVSSSFSVAPGSTLWISVESNGGTNGTFQLCINSLAPAPTPGNTCATATNICDKSPISIPSLAGITSSGVFPTCFDLAVQRDSWIKFTVGVTGTLEFTGTPIGANEYDWAVYNVTAGCLGTLVSCNYNYSTDAFGCGIQGAPFGMLPSSVGQPCPAEFNAPIIVTAGQTYALLIDNYDATVNGFNLTWGGTFQMGTAAIFTATPQSFCSVPATVNIVNNSVGATTYAWDFGDSTNSNSPNPGTHTYTSAGTYLITLVITGNGCTSVLSQRINVNTGPTVTVTPPSATIFAGASQNLSGVITLGTAYNDRQFSSSVNTAIPNNNAAGITNSLNSTGMLNTTLTAGSVQSICFTINHTSHSDIGFGATPNAVTVTVNANTYSFTPLPLPSATGTATYCFPQTVLNAISAAGGNSNTLWTIKVADRRGAGGGTGSLVNWNVILRDINSIVSYAWSPTTNMTNPTTLTPTVSPTGNVTYTLTATDLFGCTGSFAVPITVTPPPVAPTASVTIQPNCSTPTGTIVITAPTGGTLEYSVNGTIYQAGTTFAGLAPGSYNVTVRTVGTTCASTANVLTINPVPTAPAAPTGTVTAQPTCVTTTGTIVLTAPTGATLEYSINGTTYQTGTTFAGLAPGSYNATVRDSATGCVSLPTTFTINPIPAAPAVPTGSVTTQPTCITTTGTIVITAPTGATLEYSVDGTNYQAGTTFTGLASGNYNVTVRDTATGCVSSATVLTVNPIPAPPVAPTATVTAQPTCITTTGTIVITAPTGATLEYSIDGTTYQAGTTFTGLASAIYNVTVRDTATGCVSSPTTLTVNPIPAPPAAPTASVTFQPTCITTTGTIVVTAPTGATLEYSNNGTTYQAGTTFAGLAPGNYNITVRDINTGCVSAPTTLTVNPVPAPPVAPTATVSVQPTCTVPTGTITITAPIAATFEYRINGTTYQPGTTFAGVAPGTYNVTVREINTGCVSAPTSLTVNPIPGAPAAPTATVTVQPTCTTPTGTIVITAPTGATLEYSTNGTTYQPGTTFAGLAPGNYNVTVRNTATGCISTATVLTVNPVPNAPAAPTVSATVQPTCTLPTGTILITAPLGFTLQYSINGVTYQPGLIFAGLAPGVYNVTVRNTTTGCVSAATVVTVNPITPAPAAPTSSVTFQPNCITTTGTIDITAPTGATLQYSVDGTNYQGGTTFAGLAPGIYNVTVRDLLTGCVSNATVLTVNPIPAAPAAPTASVIFQPNCNTTSGTIGITAPIGAGFEYSIDGATYQAGTLFAGLASGSFNVTVRDIATGCVSAPTVLTVDPITPAPPAPTASTTVQPNCSTPTGTIVVTLPTGGFFEYSIDGVNYQAGTTFAGLASGNYSVTVRNLSTGCVSSATIVTVAPITPAPAAPTATTTVQPTCTTPTGTIVVSAPIGLIYTYSIDGITYQSGTAFAGLASGTYNVTVRDTNTGCTSNATAVTVNAITPAPAAPTATVTAQPNCIVTTGTITISVPSGVTLEYSINGTTYQAGTTFAGLAPGTYNVTVRDLTTGCISSATALTINPVPAPPATPTITNTQPTCPAPDGTIAVTAPLAATYEYTIDGTTYQASETFTGLAPGSYNLSVRDTTTGCVSTSIPITIDAVPLAETVAIVQGCVGFAYTLQVSPFNSESIYEWFNGAVSVGNNSTLVVNTTGAYSVDVTSITGCVSHAVTTVSAVKCMIPKGVSPNNDTYNDEFDLTGFNVEELKIYNRYGAEVYKYGANYTNQWHGQSNAGNILPDATYYYAIKIQDGEVKTGWVYINQQSK